MSAWAREPPSTNWFMSSRGYAAHSGIQSRYPRSDLLGRYLPLMRPSSCPVRRTVTVDSGSRLGSGRPGGRRRTASSRSAGPERCMQVEAGRGGIINRRVVQTWLEENCQLASLRLCGCRARMILVRPHHIFMCSKAKLKRTLR
eukprot:761733-Hanusia_phi.AAC.2